MLEKDLKRSAIEKAEACVIMAEKYQKDPFFVDFTNIFIFLSIQKYLNNCKNRKEPLPIIIQLIKPENKKNFNAIIKKEKNAVYNIIVGSFN
jgi:hypothetical protein